MVLYSI